MAAAGAAPRGDRADRRRLCAAVPAGHRISRPRPAARATSSCCSIGPTAWATPIRGRARSARRRRRSTARRRPIAFRWCCLPTRRSSYCDRRRIDRARWPRSDAATPGPGSTKYGPALKLAGSLLAESLLPRKEVILVSDFQRGGWQPDDTLRLPGGTHDHDGDRRRRAGREPRADAGGAAALA